MISALAYVLKDHELAPGFAPWPVAPPAYQWVQPSARRSEHACAGFCSNACCANATPIGRWYFYRFLMPGWRRAACGIDASHRQRDWVISDQRCPISPFLTNPECQRPFYLHILVVIQVAQLAIDDFPHRRIAGKR
jgi:hypothetical protein